MTTGKLALYLALLALGLAGYATIVAHQGDDVWLNSDCDGQLVGDILSQIATMASGSICAFTAQTIAPLEHTPRRTTVNPLRIMSVPLPLKTTN